MDSVVNLLYFAYSASRSVVNICKYKFKIFFLSSSDASDAPSSQASTDLEQTASLISMPSLISVSDNYILSGLYTCSPRAIPSTQNTT